MSLGCIFQVKMLRHELRTISKPHHLLIRQSPGIRLHRSKAFYSVQQQFSPPLQGIKVLDLSRILAGPSAAQLLGDLGCVLYIFTRVHSHLTYLHPVVQPDKLIYKALYLFPNSCEVIKIEEPNRGDDTRWLHTKFEQEQDPQVFKPSSTLSNYFTSCNRNKKSLNLNLKKPEAIHILKKLIVKSDVLIENFIVGKMEELGLGYDILRELNPRLIYSSISGYGTTGPMAKAAGYDVIAAARSGLMSITGEPDRPPMKTGVAICDVITGLHATIGILSSLYNRDRHSATNPNMGQKVETSLFESTLSILFNVGSSYLNSGEDGQRWGTSHPAIVPYQAFEVQDGFMIIGTTNNRQFEKLCDAIKLEHLKQDPRFNTNSKRVENRIELIDILGDKLRSKPASFWVEKLTTLGLPCSRVNSIKEAFQEPQTHARQMIHQFDSQDSFTGTPIKLSKSPLKISSAPPRLGQHTKEILKGLGYTDDQLDELMKNSVI